MQILCAVLIVAACFVSKILVLFAGIASMAYMFSNAKWEQKIAFFMFMLSFSPIIKFDKDQTSLFIFLRIAVILSYIFQHKEKLSFNFVTLMIAFFAYCFILSEVFNTGYLRYLINMMIWTIIGYIICNSLKSECATPVARSLMNGLIITGVIGLFINEVPALRNMVEVLASYGFDGAIVYRYAGFWNDPNHFTVLLITAVWCIYFEYNKKRVNIAEFFSRCILASFIGLMTMSKSCLLLLGIFWIYVIISKNDIKTAAKVSIVFLMTFAVIIFLWKNPYWISDIFYRFNAGNDQSTFNTITTGRFDLWIAYLRKLFSDFSWITGCGIDAKLLYVNGIAKGAHNAYIQMIFSFGVIGTMMYIALFRKMYTLKKEKAAVQIKNVKRPEKMAFFSLLLSLFFLDALYIEMYYYMIGLIFVYMLSNSADIDNNEGEVSDEQTVI